MVTVASTDLAQERPPINALNMWALSLAMLSFVIPVILSIPAFILAGINRSRLRGDDPATTMNRKLAKLAQASSIFTAALVAVYVLLFGLG